MTYHGSSAIYDPEWESFDSIRRSTFRISCKNSKTDGHGTAFLIAVINGRALLATAKHVVAVEPVMPALPVFWTVREIDDTGTVAREISFQIGPGESDAGRITCRNSDLAAILLPLLKEDGAPFLRPNEIPLCVQVMTKVCAPTTKVWWVGYPGDIEHELVFGSPQLCCYSGIVAACRDQDSGKYKGPIYIVDGHSAYGVSGGPVWCRSEVAFATNPYTIVGIVSEYGYDPERKLPGYCIFVPVNELLATIHAAFNFKPPAEGSA